jgi:hypothetical protein
MVRAADPNGAAGPVAGWAPAEAAASNRQDRHTREAGFMAFLSSPLEACLKNGSAGIRFQRL